MGDFLADHRDRVAAERALAGDWGKLTATERGRLRAKLAELIKERVDELAHIEALDVGPSRFDETLNMLRAERATEELRVAGLEVVETIIGDPDFAAAAGDVLHSREIDDVVNALKARTDAFEFAMSG